MTLRQYLIVMSIATVICWIALIVVVVNVDPFTGSALSFFFFYVSAWLALLGTLSLILFLMHKFFQSDVVPLFRTVEKSFRDAIVLSAALTLLLYIQSKNWLYLWNAIILIAAVVLIIIFRWLKTKSFSNSHL